jgi:hypothetical protein
MLIRAIHELNLTIHYNVRESDYSEDSVPFRNTIVRFEKSVSFRKLKVINSCNIYCTYFLKNNLIMVSCKPKHVAEYKAKPDFLCFFLDWITLGLFTYERFVTNVVAPFFLIIKPTRCTNFSNLFCK